MPKPAPSYKLSMYRGPSRSPMIVRAFDEVARATDDSVQALTRKVALFLGDRFLITVHGKDHAFIDVIGNKHRESSYTQDLRHRPRADAAIA